MGIKDLRISNLEYLVVIILVNISGSPIFYRDQRREVVLLATALFFFGLLLHKKEIVVSRRFHLICYLFAIIFLLQGVSFYFFPFITILGFILTIFIGYAALRIVRDLPSVYIEVLFWIAMISLCFYLSDNLLAAIGIDLRSFFNPVRQFVGTDRDFHVLVYKFATETHVNRNSGIFWEPGAFAGYLLLALLFLGFRKSQYTNKEYWKRLIVLTVTLLTTLSTMGYVVLPIILLLHMSWHSQTKTSYAKLLFLAYVAAPLLFLFVYNSWKLDFMQTKIEQQYEKVAEKEGNWEMTRYGTLLYDWEYIKRRPLLGWGLHDKTRFQLHHGVGIGGMGNGLSGAIHKIGIIGFGIWALYVWRGMRCLSNRNFLRSLLALCGLLLILNGEQFLNFPLFWGLMFLDQGPRATGDSLDLDCVYSANRFFTRGMTQNH